jgi:hypothetical protein
MAMGCSLSPIISNIYVEHFETVALESAQHKPFLWLHYVNETCVVWSHGPERLQNFLKRLNSPRPSIQFTMAIEPDSVIPFLDFLVIKKEWHWPPKSTEKQFTMAIILTSILTIYSAREKKFNTDSSQKMFQP